MSPSALVRHLGPSAFVDHPDAVVVRESETVSASLIELRVHPDDLGKVIGRKGQTARALRTVLSAASFHHHRRTLLNILEE